MKRRRVANPFGMSFLDVMFCGFGSVVLLVMIVNTTAVARREALHEDLRGEVDRLEREVLTGEKYLVELRAAIDAAVRRCAPRARRARRSAARERRSRASRRRRSHVPSTSTRSSRI